MKAKHKKKKDYSQVTIQIGWSALVDLQRLVNRGANCISYDHDGYSTRKPESLSEIRRLLKKAKSEMKLLKARAAIDKAKKGD